VAVTIGLPALAATFEQLRLTRRAALAQLAITITGYVQRWDEPDLVEARTTTGRMTSEELRDAVVDAYSRGATGNVRSYLRVPNYFEDLGRAAHQGIFPQGALTAALGAVTAAAWEHWRATVAALRKLLGDPSIYSEFEWLAKESSAHRAVL
jgi:hypothetical protein